MSTLQISLAIIGGLVLAGVVAYNAWVTRKSVPRLGDKAVGGLLRSFSPRLRAWCWVGNRWGGG